MPSAALAQEGGNRHFERIEGGFVAKEVGDADQQILQQRHVFGGVFAQKAQVFRQVRQPVDLQAPRESPQNGGAFVVDKVVAGRVFQQFQNLPQGGFGVGRRLVPVGRLDRGQFDIVFVGEQFDEARGHLGDRQNPINHAGFDGAARHLVVLRVRGFLGDGQSAALFDALETDGAVGIGARQNHADGARLLRFGQGAKEQINRDAAPAFALELRQFDVPVVHRQQMRRRNNVNMVALELHVFGDLRDRHGGDVAQNRVEIAFVVGRQMQDDHERHAGFGRQFAKKSFATRR